MRHCLKTVLALSCLMFGLQFASSSASATSSSSFSTGTKTLTAAQCVIVRKALADYIALINKLLGANNPLAQTLIALAQADTNKICPLPSVNNFSTTSPFECRVVDPTGTLGVSLGLNATGGLTNTLNPVKVACVSQNACTTIVTQVFTFANMNATPRCADPADPTVFHLTDAEVQTKVNALLGH